MASLEITRELLYLLDRIHEEWRTSIRSDDIHVAQHARIQHAVYKGILVDYLDEAIERTLQRSPQRPDE
ncbi:hypothetical protein NVV94_15195 [Pseudomonas sp. LS1212]|uniref:hypothetical protein n=1 Tax=Pseudomonas sp. LS1212 TaxID=2972478 RepID=UPI00215BB427|nr:hypothetical protein [Pseudomonas sp. LS1212]UVJ42027.1 hypothetical protein NVV94_15195 [Pseudomonas sp. LS1212]